MNDYYETIIVGAGPGGLIAGRLLNNALILDQKKEIGKPVQCGEGISDFALKLQGIKPDPSWISSYITTVQRITPNGKIIGKLHSSLGYVIDRTAFENFLAKDSKAEIRLNAKIIDFKKEGNLWKVITGNNEVFKSKYLIGADGFNSIVRKKIFQQEVELVPALDYLVKLERELDAQIIKIYLNNEKFPSGYAWIFPKSKNTANIGLGGDGNLLEKFQNFMEEIVKKDYGNCEIIENKSGTIPIRKKEAKFFKDNAILVGDAAGLADPLFKGGMSQAMLSGKIAAQCIIKNEANHYEAKIKSMPFTDTGLFRANKIFYSFNNQVLNELGEVLEGKGTSYLKTIPGIMKVLLRPNLRKNIFTIFKFFSIWEKNHDYLW